MFICRVRQNVRPALEDHANDAERHAHARNVEDHWAGRYTSRQPGFVGSVKWYWMGPMPLMAMIAGSVSVFFTPS